MTFRSRDCLRNLGWRTKKLEIFSRCRRTPNNGFIPTDRTTSREVLIRPFPSCKFFTSLLTNNSILQHPARKIIIRRSTIHHGQNLHHNPFPSNNPRPRHLPHPTTIPHQPPQRRHLPHAPLHPTTNPLLPSRLLLVRRPPPLPSPAPINLAQQPLPLHLPRLPPQLRHRRPPQPRPLPAQRRGGRDGG